MTWIMGNRTVNNETDQAAKLCAQRLYNWSRRLLLFGLTCVALHLGSSAASGASSEGGEEAAIGALADDTLEELAGSVLEELSGDLEFIAAYAPAPLPKPDPIGPDAPVARITILNPFDSDVGVDTFILSSPSQLPPFQSSLLRRTVPACGSTSFTLTPERLRKLIVMEAYGEDDIRLDFIDIPSPNPKELRVKLAIPKRLVFHSATPLFFGTPERQ